ncbi:MAG: hypothetical protein KGM24_13335 [Elusimicrobia bacterium]|nr:hypothetical protein [Elusimicrobiota bacterium]
MKKTLSFARSFLLRPSEAADASARPDAWRPALVLYALLALAQLVESWANPLAFLDPNAPAPLPHRAGFWLAVLLWEPVLMAMSVAFTVVVLDWMSAGWLPLKTAAATLWAAVPAALAAYYASRPAADRSWFVGLLAAWTALTAVQAARVPRGRWRPVAVFLLGMSAIQLVGLAAEFLLVLPSRSMHVFYAYSIVLLVWVAACFGAGMRRLKISPSAARAVLAFVFALIASSVVPFLAYFLGLMPRAVLKVVLYV